MKSKNRKYFKKLDIIRILACIAIFMYHLGFLKGGYLAVCIFFVLSGYLSVESALKKEDFSLKEYYITKFKRLYLPLIIVVFLSITAVSFIPNAYWLNIKNETTSVLFGYNNFWQINANLDYFARHIDSPFMHLWYISILIQFDLIFPFLYKLLNKGKEKISKHFPVIISSIFTITGIVLFYTISKNNLMNGYYNTLTRVFSLFLGVTLGYTKNTYEPLLIFKDNKILNNIVFYLYILLSILMFIFIPSTSKYFIVSMILISIMTVRMIEYGTYYNGELNIFDKIIKGVSSITYEVYLVQYPVIFIFQYLDVPSSLKTLLIVLIVLVTSVVIHFMFKKEDKINLLRFTVIVLISLGSLYGSYIYITSKSYEKEIEELKNLLKENELVMKAKQSDYELQEKQNEEDWKKELEELENPKNYENIIKKLQITFIGDSVMLGAMNDINKTFPNSYFDAKESRQITTGYKILEELKKENKLGEIVVIHLGTNGDCSYSFKEKLMNLLSDKIVFWINTTNNEKFNSSLEKLKDEYSNLHIINWHDLSMNHKDWFYHDGIHLPQTGRKNYTKIIYNEIYEVYKDKLKDKKQKLIQEHLEELRNKISFYGNDILFYNFTDLQENYPDARFSVNTNYSFKDLKDNIKKSLEENTLSNKIVLSFDNSTIISIKEYAEIIEVCKDSKVYIVSTTKPLTSLSNYKNAVIINFYEEIQKHKDYLMADGIHLTEKGNKALINTLKNKIK